MFQKSLKIYKSTVEGSIKEMLHSILHQADCSLPILEITLFHAPDSNEQYTTLYNEFKAIISDYYTKECPLVSYIAQKPCNAPIVAEFTLLNDSSATIEKHPNYILLKSQSAKELISAGLNADITESTYGQACDIFESIEDILAKEGFTLSDIYRQWNYIEGIVSLNKGKQNYQEFNDARSLYYSKSNWTGGYPAATGIGQSYGGVIIEINAFTGCCHTNIAIDNPLQISAHNYSKEVLAGNKQNRTTPKFERARMLGNTIYISGTAAIKGESSIATDCAKEQTMATMEIMDFLTSPQNTNSTKNSYDTLRVYIKREEDAANIMEYMQQHYPAPQKTYLFCDICRPELLVEIEGVAHTAQ
ncbi:MAG: hypothetical protein IKV17_05960 [Bacteroidaceae bacterium]|nr:hypothetical protein [Bacteroidaceae bacterium]